MEKAFAKVEELVDNLKEYLNTRIESVKLSTAEKTSAVITSLIVGFITAFIFIFFIIFISAALAIVLGEWFGKIWLGFLSVAFLFLLLVAIVWILRGKIIRLPIMNALIQQLFTTEDEKD